KENVIVGRLIPAGTGSYVNRIRKVAAERDKVALAAQQSAAAVEEGEMAALPSGDTSKAAAA
ncbi:MAG: hypothetical protein KDJ49_02255, partial [Alphaproteobacteria bacterium]|nr:hypothetical protein [Alphaproteobacteria bacterium]